MDPIPVEHSPPRLTIFLVSAAALAYEILLMRLFSIIQYHHFAYMVISLALLGYGASGTFLTFFRERLRQYYSFSLIISIVLFGLTAVACYLYGQHLLINPDELLWQGRLWLKLFALYLLLALPFFFAANCIALTFSQYRENISDVYGADLFGAGFGSLCIIGVLFIIMPQNGLLLLGGVILATPVVTSFELQIKPRYLILVFPLLATVPFLLPAGWIKPAVSPYKGLSQQMRIRGSRIIEEQTSPLGLLTVVENQIIPFRHAPGLSLKAKDEPPEQIGIFTDGDSLNVITRFPEDIAGLTYLDMVTSALPYHLHHMQNILLLGAGTGADVLQALYFKTVNITGVEINPQLIELVQERPAFSGRIFNRDNVHIHTGEARSFIGSSTDTFDLIQLPFLDSFGSSAAGLYALNENYLYTVEALKEYIGHLSPDGYLCLSRWIKLPPRDTLKLFATGVSALKVLGVKKPGNHIAMIRSWQSGSLIIKKSAFIEKEIGAIKKFCRERLFDLVFYPGIQADEANRFNILLEPSFYRGAVSLLQNNSKTFLADYKFNIEPATDDRPYFANFFKWQTLPEIIKLRGRGGMLLLESGYLILAVTLIQALIASIGLILLPVLTRTLRTKNVKRTWSRFRTALYFSAIGLGFLFLEIAFMQKFILYLGHPLYAAAAVLAIFLVFAGLGSRYVRHKRLHAIWPVVIIIILGALELPAAAIFFKLLSGSAIPIKVLAAVLLLGPLAFCMGIPFPLALADIGTEQPALIPWAWAINGCASVVAAVLAALLAIHFGFTAVIYVSLALYGTAAAVFPGVRK